jgi:hypothetical protein
MKKLYGRMLHARKLVVRHETIALLTPLQLNTVAGGSDQSDALESCGATNTFCQQTIA